MMKEYVLNKETKRIELNFSKEEFNLLTAEEKRNLKSAFLFSGKSKAWVSRSTENHYRAITIANKLGFEKEIIKGQLLSFEEELEIKREKAENKQSRYEGYSENAIRKGKNLQSELESYKGDIAFFTQPIIRGHRGSESFAKRREKIFNKYRNGFDEYRKSEYFSERAKAMQDIIDDSKFKDRVYLSNRIKECKSLIKKYEKNISWCESNNSNDSEHWLEKLNYTIDKLAYIENCLDDIGGIKYNSENLKIGYEIKIRGHWNKILKLNPKTVESQPLEEHLKMCYGKNDYSEIQEMRIPKDLKVEDIENPFKVNDFLIALSFGGNRIIKAYKVTKVTEKCVNIKEVIIKENNPIDEFKEGGKEGRKKIKKGKINNKIYIDDGNYILYPHNNNNISI